jgi:nucleotide-binding universal stress UspA family protein
MVVLGSSSRSAWAERWLGSTPSKIAAESPYPTLLIPPAKA